MLWELGVLASVRSLDSKIQNIGLWRSTHRRLGDCCVPVFTEIWFNNNILETGIEFDWLTLHRADRVAASSGKHREQGFVVYTNDSWFRSIATIRISGSQKGEYMIVICQPFIILLWSASPWVSYRKPTQTHSFSLLVMI